MLPLWENKFGKKFPGLGLWVVIEHGAYEAEENCIDHKSFIMTVEIPRNPKEKKKKIGTNGIRSEKKV
jgi:hypothetical protein